MWAVATELYFLQSLIYKSPYIDQAGPSKRCVAIRWRTLIFEVSCWQYWKAPFDHYYCDLYSLNSAVVFLTMDTLGYSNLVIVLPYQVGHVYSVMQIALNCIASQASSTEIPDITDCWRNADHTRSFSILQRQLPLISWISWSFVVGVA